jgi:peptide-methionine (S)-S-oxide reductase
VSYATLVDLAFAAHNPARAAHKAQYASLVLAHDDSQLAVAGERARRVSAAMGGRVLTTRIERLDRAWIAEDYHQKYYLRQDKLLAGEFTAMFGGDEAALRESTSAARVNGYVAGDGTRAQLAREIDFLGLTEAGRQRLVAKTGVGPSGGCAL